MCSYEGHGGSKMGGGVGKTTFRLCEWNCEVSTDLPMGTVPGTMPEETSQFHPQGRPLQGRTFSFQLYAVLSSKWVKVADPCPS